VLGEVDRVAVGIMDAKFRLAVGRTLLDIGRGTPLLGDRHDRIDALDLEPEVVDRLKTRAVNKGRSLESELRTILRSAARVTPEEYAEELKTLRDKLGNRVFESSVPLICEDRDR
jgi:plasmid stability protein